MKLLTILVVKELREGVYYQAKEAFNLFGRDLDFIPDNAPWSVEIYFILCKKL